MKNFNWKDLLLKHPLFSGLNMKEVERIIAQLLDDKVSEEREYSEGKFIVREGELGDSVFLVGGGSVQVVLEGENGSGTPISTLRQGEFFGEMALLEQKPRAATVKAKESCVLLEIKGQEFLKLLDEHKDVESKMLLKLSERLRHANEQVMAGRVKGVDDKLETLKIKHEAELKAVDASLKAAQTVFDQTKIRTDEIIHSAERSRTRLTSVLAVITAIIGLFGWLGFKELLDIRKERENIAKMAGEAKTDAEFVTKTKEDMKSTAKLNELIHDISTRLARNVLLPAFEDAMEKNNGPLATDLYADLRKFKAEDPDFIATVLNRIEERIIEQPNRDYTALLRVILDDAKVSEDIIKCRYLLLTNAILVVGAESNTGLPRGETFGATLSSFQEYVKKHTDKKVSREYLYRMEKVFEQQDKQKREAFNGIRRIILKP